MLSRKMESSQSLETVFEQYVIKNEVLDKSNICIKVGFSLLESPKWVPKTESRGKALLIIRHFSRLS